MARFRRNPWLLVLPVLAVCLASNVCFIQSFNYSAFDKQGLKEFLIVFSLEFFLVNIFLLLLIRDCSRHQGKSSERIGLRSTSKEDAGGARLHPPYAFYRLACEAATRKGLGVEEYLSNVLRFQDEFIKSKEIVDRDGFLEALRNAMLRDEFTLVLGGKNLGKTLMRNQTICEMENAANATLTIIDVNMREHPSEELFNAILQRVEEKSRESASILKQILGKVASSLGGLASAVAVGANSDKVAAPAATPISSAITALIERLSSSEKEKTLSKLVGDLQGKGNATCIVVDEANIALPGLPATNSESRWSTLAQRALQYFVMITKETGVASIVLFSSELGYPYRLQACGMNLQDIQNIIIANEVPKKDMLSLMVNRWSMSADLAEEFFTYFGGHIDLCSRGVKQLRRFGKDFDPFAVHKCIGLPTCAGDPDAKKHLLNLTKQGWSPVYDIKEDRGAKLIAEENVGGIVPKDAKAFDLPEGIWEGEHENALVPSGTLMRWKIARELERVDSVGARNLDALLVEQKTQLHAVFSHFACFRSQGSFIVMQGLPSLRSIF